MYGPPKLEPRKREEMFHDGWGLPLPLPRKLFSVVMILIAGLNTISTGALVWIVVTLLVPTPLDASCAFLMGFAVFVNVWVKKVSEICLGETIGLQCQSFSGTRRRKEVAGGDNVGATSGDARESYLRVISWPLETEYWRGYGECIGILNIEFLNRQWYLYAKLNAVNNTAHHITCNLLVSFIHTIIPLNICTFQSFFLIIIIR